MMRMRLGKMNLKRMMKMSEEDFEDGVDDYSPLYRDKTTFSDELEDE